jgi:putative NIF3 family GTP cyclohydrolase 1 type 2
LPFIMWQVWKFIAPALYENEKKMAVPFVFWSTVVMTKVNEYCERLIVENGFGVVTQKEITGNDLLLTGDMKQPLYKFVNDDGVNEIFYK